MIAGVPGTGIGGIFYLISAAMMPVREIGKVFQGRSNVKRWKFVSWQMVLTAGVFSGFWLTGLCLGMLIPTAASAAVHSQSILSNNVFHFKPVMISLSVLGGVLCLVEVMNLFMHPSRK